MYCIERMHTFLFVNGSAKLRCLLQAIEGFIKLADLIWFFETRRHFHITLVIEVAVLTSICSISQSFRAAIANRVV